MDRSSYLNPGSIRSQCDGAIEILQENNQELEIAAENLSTFIFDEAIQSQAFQSLKQQLRDYLFLIRAMKSANT